MEFDLNAAFNDAWHNEVEDRTAKSGIDPADWRAAGRKSKEWPNKEDSSWWLTNGPVMAQNYINWRQEGDEKHWKLWEPAPGEPAIELGITAPIGGVTVKGYIDRIFHSPPFDSIEPDRLIIVDLKTGSRNPESDLQLGFYASLVEVAFGVRPSFGAYYKARDGKLIKPLVPLEHYSLEFLGGLLRDYVRARNNGIYIPNIGSHCNNCGVARACAAVNGSEAIKYDPHHPGYGRNIPE